MGEGKAPKDFSMKDWKNFGIYILLLGLVMMFVMEEWKTGAGFFAVGFFFTLIFQGKKIFKILNKS